MENNEIKDAEIVATSPLPKKIEVKDEDVEKLMTFPQAMEAVIEGKRITKEEWDSEEVWGEMKEGFLIIHRDGKDHQWIISEGDLTGDDYVTIN
jgi:hypothetical protein